MRPRLLLLAFLSLLFACGPAAQGLSGGVRRGAASDPAAYTKAVSEGDAAFAARADRAQLELAIARYQEAVKLKDDDWQTYEKLARASYLLADGWLFFEKDDKEQLFLDTYQQGYAAAERGLAALSPEVEKKLSLGVDLKDAAALVPKEGIGLLYWYATNLGKWGNAQDITVVVRYKERIFNIMNRVLDIDPTFFHGAPHRYFGAFYSIAPPAFGGDLELSKKHFDETRKIEPNYHATYNLIAEFYAPKKKDGALFDEMIEKVRSLPLDAVPGLEAEAAIEKRKAELLVSRREAGEFPFD